MIRKSYLHVLSVIFAFSFATHSAAEQTIDGKSARKVTYEDDVKPIFRQHCMHCHNQGDKGGGLALDSFGAMIEGGGSGDVIDGDGDPDASRLWQLVNHDDTPVMPPSEIKLPAKELKIIRAWIEGGILENSSSKAKEKKKNALAAVTTSLGRPEGGGVMPPMTIPQTVPVVTERAGAITAIATAPWAPLVAIAGQRQIVLYHTDTNELLGVLPFEEGIPQSLRFSRDGAFLVAGGGEHSVRGIAAVYDMRTGGRVAGVGDDLDTVFEADVNDNMQRVALGGPQKMLRIFDATDGSLLFDIKKHTDWIYAVAFSPDGVLVASADRSGGLHVWEADTGRQYLDLPGHKGAIRALKWRDDSNVLASAGEDGTLRLWDVNSGKQIKSINVGGGAVTAIDIDHSGRLVTGSADRRVRLFAADGNKIRDLRTLSDEVLEVAISHDGKRAIAGDWNGLVVSMSTENPDQHTTLAANPPPVSVRITSTQQSLESKRKELAPLAGELDQAQQALAGAKAKLSELDQSIASVKDQIAKAEQQRSALEKQRTETIASIKTETAAGRDLMDAVIAARVQAKNGGNEVLAPLESEEKYVAHLSALIAKRKSIPQLSKQIAAASHHRESLAEQAKKLEPGRAALLAGVEAAQNALAEASAAHEAVAKVVSRLEQKQQHLASIK
ncbi:MAG: c-type cytochrome domain-containing protein [Planctomycetota bacterium]